MQFDVFFSFSKMPHAGVMPADGVLYERLFQSIEFADALGFERAWVGEAHYSLAPEQSGDKPLLPHFKGELCINTDILQVAAAAMPRTRQISIGSAIRNILVNGGPVAHAEMVRTFLTIHGEALRSSGRKLCIGFGAGRFAYANAANGVAPRNEAERLLWPQLRGLVLREATEIFLRLLRGETLGSEDVAPKVLHRDKVDPEVWTQACQVLGTEGDELTFAPFWEFSPLRIIPADVGLEQLELVLGSHDPELQAYANSFLPVNVFNLSVTPDQVIDATHERMAQCFHPDGGAWSRDRMPRTIMVFVRNDLGFDDASLDALAENEAREAMMAYWNAMEGTVDEEKVRKGMSNAVYGCPATVAAQIQARFHPEDRLMTWFDFNAGDVEVVKQRMRDFAVHVKPLLSPAQSVTLQTTAS